MRHIKTAPWAGMQQALFVCVEWEETMRRIMWFGLLLACLGGFTSRADWAENKFGPALVNQSGKRMPTGNALKGKRIIGLYFSAHWCGPCRQFTPLLVKFYQDCMRKHKALEIIFVSLDNSTSDMEKYMSGENMPWLAIPYNSPSRKQLQEEYKITGIPTLIILNQNGKVISKDGRGDVHSKGEKAYDYWISPKDFQNNNPRPSQSPSPKPKNGKSGGKRKGKKK